jgi:hypothetical protein
MPDVHAAILDQTEMKVLVETRGLNVALADAGQMLDYAIAHGLLAAGDTALRLARCGAFPRFLLLMRGERRLAAEFHALGLGVGSSARDDFAAHTVSDGGLHANSSFSWPSPS